MPSNRFQRQSPAQIRIDVECATATDARGALAVAVPELHMHDARTPDTDIDVKRGTESLNSESEKDDIKQSAGIGY